MKALTGSFRDRAEGAIGAGCDVVVHCNGNLSEAGPVAEGAPPLSGKALERAEKALACVRDIEAFDVAAGVAEFESAMSALA
jgi:beta-N-acetylhexosaminidase